jgi:hypothetical protein
VALTAPLGIAVKSPASEPLAALGYLEEKDILWPVEAARPVSGDVKVDTDSKLRLVSVGFVTTASAIGGLSGGALTGTYTVLAVKILEEEYSYIGTTQSPSLQKQVNAGGTGSIMFGG